LQDEIQVEPPAINRLAEVRVPTLIVVGDEDVPEVREAVGIMEQGIAGAQKVVIAGTARHPQMEKPEEFNRVVLDFLNGLPR
jgi:pimeloyl-ACP methyl ester carboxylesterase